MIVTKTAEGRSLFTETSEFKVQILNRTAESRLTNLGRRDAGGRDSGQDRLSSFLGHAATGDSCAEYGFSVVAPTSVMVPSWTWGRRASCWALLNRWISSRNSTVPRPVQGDPVLRLGDERSDVGDARHDRGDRRELRPDLAPPPLGRADGMSEV